MKGQLSLARIFLARSPQSKYGARIGPSDQRPKIYANRPVITRQYPRIQKVGGVDFDS